jgi:four helix bundle protein
MATRSIISNGTAAASGWSMSVRDFRDLVAWQLADALRWEVIRFTSEGPASRDFRFRDDIRASAGSAPSNIAEGFGRFRPPFAQFLEYAKASLEETQDHLIEAKDRALIDAKLFERLWNLAKAAERATTNLLLSKLRQAEAERQQRSAGRARTRPAARAKPRQNRSDT